MHTPYRFILKREKPDFVIKYKLIDERRIKEPPFQGLRTNFMYAEDESENKYTHTIFPEYLEKNGEIMMETNKHIQLEGFANMWIVVEQSIDFHKQKLKVGGKGFIIEGVRKIAECEIIEVNI